jgi:hypothetical protein
LRSIRTAVCLLCLGGALLPAGQRALAQGAATEDPCGKARAAPDALYKELARDPKLREMGRSDLYVGLEDGRDGTLWTFTLPAHPAHPAAICRRIMERRGIIEIPTTVECKGPEKACARLRSDFDILNERVISDLYAKRKPK